MTQRVLILPSRYGEFCSDGMGILQAAGLDIVENPFRRPLEPAETARMMQGVHAIIVSPDNIISGDIIRGCPSLKVIGTRSVGYDHIDLQAAAEVGITVSFTPWTNHQATADQAFALLMAVSRRIAEADRLVRSGRWKRVIGNGVWGKTLGIVGMGAVGQSMALRAKGFAMRVLYYSRARKDDLEKEIGMEYRPLDELLRQSDYVSLHLALTEQTRGLIGERELSLMQPKAFLINTARGGLVDQEALCLALSEQRIAGAGLDVFVQEPLESDSPLLSMENVVLSPHIAGATNESIAAMGRVVSEDVVRVLRGETPLFPVMGLPAR